MHEFAIPLWAQVLRPGPDEPPTAQWDRAAGPHLAPEVAWARVSSHWSVVGGRCDCTNELRATRQITVSAAYVATQACAVGVHSVLGYELLEEGNQGDGMPAVVVGAQQR